jgi:hypothetical protein
MTMKLKTIEMNSPLMGSQVSMNVIAPFEDSASSKKYPVVYFNNRLGVT